MRIVDLRWRRYRIPFRRPVATAHGEMAAREGAIVEVVTDEGVIGVGEIAPLPQFGSTLDDALAPLFELRRIVTANSWDDAVSRAVQQWENLPAATRFGLETALLDAQARALGERKTDLPLGVPVNATVAVREPDKVAVQVRRAARQGFRVVKLKVGICDSPENEVARIEAARRASPGVRLRLDANEAWTLDQAVDILTRVGDQQIEYCEQPLERNDLEGARRLRDRASVAIAADEAVTDVQSARRVLEARAADVLVLKPQCLGGAAVCRRLVLGLPADIRWVVTSSMEAGVGVNAALHIAAYLHAESARPQASVACGLATLDLLEDDLIVEPPHIEDGVMHAPRGPGLGMELDRAALAKYAVD